MKFLQKFYFIPPSVLYPPPLEQLINRLVASFYLREVHPEKKVTLHYFFTGGCTSLDVVLDCLSRVKRGYYTEVGRFTLTTTELQLIKTKFTSKKQGTHYATK